MAESKGRWNAYDTEFFGPLSFCGISFYWAWIYSSFFVAPETGSLGFGFDSAARTVASLLGLILVLLVFLRRSSWLRATRLARIAVVGSLLATVSSVTVAFLVSSGLPVLLLIFGNGIGTGLLLVCWGKMYGRLTARQSESRIALSLLVAVLLCMACHAFSQEVRLAVVAVFPVVSALCLLYALRSLQPGPSAEEPKTMKLPWRLMLGLFLCGVSFGFIMGFTVLTPASAPFVEGALLLAEAFVAIFMMIFTALRGQTVTFKGTYWIILPLIGLGFLILPLLGSGQFHLSFFLARVGYTFFDVLVWVQLSDLSARNKADTIRVFCAIRLALDGGVMLGNLTSVCLWDLISTNLPLISAVLVFLLIVVFNRCLNQESIKGAWGMLGEADGEKPRWRNVCEQLAEEKGLTSREIQIMELIAQGRSAANISKTLFISVSTVQTHSKNLYRKLGIHSRQELLDLIEQQRARSE